MLHRDPLVHFLVIGAILFAALTWLGGSETPPDRSGTPPSERIVVTAEDVAELARSAELLAGRPPTDAELRELVADEIRNEVYYRQALALELDVDDDEVRQRLIEKMRYTTENTADPAPPDADYEAFFEANAERFRIPPLVTFDQVFFSPRMRGESARSDAEEALEALRRGAEPGDLGDSTPLSSRFEDADPDRVRILFGDALTETVFAEPEDVWLGPFESDFGWHLVRIVARSGARDPEFAEVEARVREVYAAERLEAANEAAYQRMRDNFDIAVEWEADEEPEPWP